MSLRYFTFLSWLTIWSFILNGQNIADIKAKYPGQNELILKDKQTYRFSLYNEKPKIISDNYFESLILSEAGIQNTSESFSGFTFPLRTNLFLDPNLILATSCSI